MKRRNEEASWKDEQTDGDLLKILSKAPVQHRLGAVAKLQRR